MSKNAKINTKNAAENGRLVAISVPADAKKGTSHNMPKVTGTKAQGVSQGGNAGVHKTVPDTKIVANGTKSKSKKR